MLDEKYVEFIKETKDLLSKIDKGYINGPNESFEDREALKIVEYLKDELEDVLYDLEMLGRDTIEGILVLNSQGRFNLDTAESLYFTCGSPIEMFVDGEWYNGRVEHDGKNYYFYNYDKENIALEEGMSARIRVDKR